MSQSILYKQIERGFRSALKSAGVDVEWEREAPDANLTLQVIINPVEEPASPLDRDSGDDNRSVLTALTSAFDDVGGVPADPEGETFRDADGKVYRVVRLDHPPHHPLAHFYCANAVAVP